VSGVDLQTLDPAAWRRRVVWVPQRPHLFAGTVADNIRLADPAASDERVEAAGSAARAGFVSELPDGFATRIGEGGAALSAGEARRIALARAFLRDAAVLVLDEPTANLDSQTASDVADAIFDASAGRTTLMITHDATLAARADRIVELEGGRSVAPMPLERAA
jgi:ABC-type multidrug transport system fused ATPase/permease subunit